MWWYQCKKMSFCFLRIMNIVSPVTKQNKMEKKWREGNEKHIEQFHNFCGALLPLLLLQYTLFWNMKNRSTFESLSDLRASLASNLYAIFGKPMYAHFPVWIT